MHWAPGWRRTTHALLGRYILAKLTNDIWAESSIEVLSFARDSVTDVNAAIDSHLGCGMWEICSVCQERQGRPEAKEKHSPQPSRSRDTTTSIPLAPTLTGTSWPTGYHCQSGFFRSVLHLVSGSRISRYMLQVDIRGIRLMSVSRPTTEDPLSHEPLLTAQVRWKALIPMEQV